MWGYMLAGPLAGFISAARRGELAYALPLLAFLTLT